MKKKLLFVVIGLIFSFTTAHAACVDTYGVGAKATALGGAFSAYADDPFAVYYNPAGLAGIDGKVMALGANFIDPVLKLTGCKLDDTSYGGFKDKSDVLVAPHLGYAMKINDKISFGIAAYAPWGLELEWGKDAAKNIGAYDSYHSYYRRFGVTPAMSYKVGPKLTLGAGVTIGRSEAGVYKKKYMLTDMGSYQIDHDNDPSTATVSVAAMVEGLRTGVGAADTGTAAEAYTAAAGNPALSEEQAQQYLKYAGIMAAVSQAGYDTGLAMVGASSPDHGIDLKTELTDDVNYSYNLGMMYKPVETLSFGLTYRSETEADFEGDVKKDGVKVTDAKMNYNHPQQIQFGVRYQPHSQFSIECDLVWTEWSINREQIVKLDDGVTAMVLPFHSATLKTERFDRKWEDTKQLRFGWEYKFTEMFTLRGGYFYDPTPVPDDTLDIQWADADKKTYSLGTGFNFGKCTIDAVIQYTDIEKARVIGGESHNFNESYMDQHVTAKADGHLLGGGITISYAF